MLYKNIIVFFSFLFLVRSGFSQTDCNALGQNPGTAFPVCGTDTFSIASVAICGDRNVPNPAGCNNVQFTDKNPYWYKFTCFAEGTLGFLITPNTLSDDYDWQIFDITGHDPADVYTDASLFVSCNWSGRTGVTGTTSNAANLTECDSDVPIFSKMPTLRLGHQYLLLVSHFSDSQSGYSLSFGGGTGSITDELPPALSGARAACDGLGISVKLNKKMKCSSVANDGTDFSISSATSPILQARGVGCSVGFDTDSVFLTLGTALAPGNYTLHIETGTDGNNLLDNCNRGIPDGQTLPVTVYPLVPTPLGDLANIGCSPDVLELSFKDRMYCNSIAGDGSDFVVSGPTPVTVSGASGVCDADGFTNVIRVKLSAPIQRAGNYRLHLQTGSDGNTVINECSVPTVEGSFKDFITADTVSAQFNTSVHYDCIADLISYTHDGSNGVNSWKWSFDNHITSSARDTVITWQTTGSKNATLVVSNGTCSDSASIVVVLDPKIKAAFESTAIDCPGDPAVVKDHSTGPVVAWAWNFGNGNTSALQSPPPQYYLSSNITSDVPIRLVVYSSTGCADTAVNTIHVVGNCYIAIPKAFSPNNDGLNDYLYPTNAYKAKDLLFRVYNRGGQMIFETRDWTNKWDGSFKGNPQDPGTYVWILQYTNIDTGKRFELKGSTVLIR